MGRGVHGETSSGSVQFLQKEDPLTLFTDLEMLGHGSFGEVFQARSAIAGDVAIKKIHLKKGFKDEVRIAILVCLQYRAAFSFLVVRSLVSRKPFSHMRTWQIEQSDLFPLCSIFDMFQPDSHAPGPARTL